MTADSQRPRPLRTFIYGSCVSRDTVERAASQYEVATYVARHSLITAFGTPQAAQVPPAITSKFQRSMLAGDAAHALVSELSREAPSLDLILWDLTDERLGIYETDTGATATNTVERIAAGFPAEGRLIRWGTTAHLTRFVAALEKFKELLEALNLKGKVILLAPPWASVSKSDETPPSSFGMTPRDGNALLRTYVSATECVMDLHAVGSTVNARFDPGHRWGKAPFHYDTQTYDILNETIRARLAGRS